MFAHEYPTGLWDSNSQLHPQTTMGKKQSWEYTMEMQHYCNIQVKLSLVKLKSSLRTFYGRRYGISVSQMTTDMFHLRLTLPGPFFIHDLSPVL